MKSILNSMLISLLLVLSVSAFSQSPPSPNGGSGAPSDGNTPVGGGAPLTGGLGIFVVLGTVYGFNKAFLFNKNDPKHENS